MRCLNEKDNFGRCDPYFRTRNIRCSQHCLEFWKLQTHHSGFRGSPQRKWALEPTLYPCPWRSSMVFLCPCPSSGRNLCSSSSDVEGHGILQRTSPFLHSWRRPRRSPFAVPAWLTTTLDHLQSRTKPKRCRLDPESSIHHQWLCSRKCLSLIHI